MRKISRLGILAALALPLLLIFMGCGGGSAESKDTLTLVLAAYTTPREAYGKAIIPSFQKQSSS